MFMVLVFIQVCTSMCGVHVCECMCVCACVICAFVFVGKRESARARARAKERTRERESARESSEVIVGAVGMKRILIASLKLACAREREGAALIVVSWM